MEVLSPRYLHLKLVCPHSGCMNLYPKFRVILLLEAPNIPQQLSLKFPMKINMDKAFYYQSRALTITMKVDSSCDLDKFAHQPKHFTKCRMIACVKNMERRYKSAWMLEGAIFNIALGRTCFTKYKIHTYTFS